MLSHVDNCQKHLQTGVPQLDRADREVLVLSLTCIQTALQQPLVPAGVKRHYATTVKSTLCKQQSEIGKIKLEAWQLELSSPEQASSR